MGNISTLLLLLLPQDASPTSKISFFNQFLRNPVPRGGASQYLMVVMLVAVFFVNPFTFSGPGVVHEKMVPHTGGVRTVLGSPSVGVSEGYSTLDAMVYVGFWVLRILVACLCFGWITLKSMPRIMANSQDSVHFWRLRKQAEKYLEQVSDPSLVS